MSREEQFHWLTYNGERIASMVHKPLGEGPFPAVLILHGFTGDKVSNHFLLVKAARALTDVGCVAMRFDFRGSGESEGRFQDVTIPGEIEDALFVFRWLAEQPYVDATRMAVLGLSLGGCVAAHVAGADPRVKALVLWAAVADPFGLFRELSENTSLESPLGWQPDGTLDVGGWLVGPSFLLTLPEVNPIAALRSYEGSALILHGTKDPTVPPKHAEMYAQALGERATLIWVEDADHTFNAHVWEQFVIRITANWLRRVLFSSPPGTEET